MSNILLSMVNFVSIGFSPFKTLGESVIAFLLLIDSKIYGMFASLYNIYIDLAQARIFDIHAFDVVINNVYVIFGVVALFMLAFTLLQSMINPDDINKSTSSVKHFLTRFFLVILLTYFTPLMFDFLYDFQASILSYGVIQKVTIGVDNVYTEDITVSVPVVNDTETDSSTENGTNAGSIQYETITLKDVDISNNVLKSMGSDIAFSVLSGFLAPANPDEDVETNASKYFNEASGYRFGFIGCVVGAGGLLLSVAMTSTGVGSFLGLAGISKGAAATYACLRGGLSASGVHGILEAITAESFKWSEAKQLILSTGNFDYITSFSEKVADGSMLYVPIVSTIAGCILLYLIFSFCLDLGVRAAKLVFYQLMAPVSFLISVIPSKKDLMTNWFKAVITTWLEVFIRIFCVCGVALLISRLGALELGDYGLLPKAIIVLGLVAFAKQAPKLLGEITGLDSGNLKLGIKDKLKEGGLFTAFDKINRFGAGVASMAAGHGNPFAFRRGWKNKWTNVGDEVKRRHQKEDAYAAGATRGQIFKDSVRKKFGFSSEADERLRNINKEYEEVTNFSSYDIEFTDDDGNVVSTVRKGDTINVNEDTINDLEAQKSKIVSNMSKINDKLKQKEKDISFGQKQIEFRKNLENEAEKDIDKPGSKINDIYYTRLKTAYEVDGKFYIEDGEDTLEVEVGKTVTLNDGREFTVEKIENGRVTAKDSAGNEVLLGDEEFFKGTYAQFVEHVNNDLSPEERQQIDLHDTRERLIESVMKDQINKKEGKIYEDLQSGFKSLENAGGYKFSYKMRDAAGNLVLDAEGKEIYLDDGMITVERGPDGKFIVEQTKNGVTEILNNRYSELEIADIINKIAKESNAVLNAQRQDIEENELDNLKGQKEALEDIIKTTNEQKEAKRKTEEQRQKEASKNYTADR